MPPGSGSSHRRGSRSNEPAIINLVDALEGALLLVEHEHARPWVAGGSPSGYGRRAVKHCFCRCGRTISRFPLDLRGMNERGRLMSERLAWALDLGIAPGPGASKTGHRSATDAGADRAEWAEEGFSHVAELRDAMHRVSNPDSLPEGPSERWLAERLYLESLAVSERALSSLSAWLEDHPGAGQELARSVPNRAGARRAS